MNVKKRKIKVAGFNVDVVTFSYATFYYPEFNGNAEFRATSKGFRQLSHYLRTVRWMDNIKNTIEPL